MNGKSVDEGKYRIRTAAELTGTTAPQLRVWEKRYGVPKPRRSDHRYRLYSEADLGELRRMRSLVTKGMSPSQAAQLVVDEREQRFSVPTRPKLDPTQADDDRREAIMTAIREFDSERLDSELNLLLRLGPVEESWRCIIRPLMDEIGRAWSQGELNPAQEHLASNGVRYTLQTMYKLIEPKEPLGTMVLACVDEELHDLPLFGLAVEMATRGWKCIMLGARVPAYAVTDALTSNGQVVGLSITMPLKGDANAFWAEYARAIGARKWIVGGQAALGYKEIIEKVGGRVITGPDEAAAVLRTPRP